MKPGNREVCYKTSPEEKAYYKIKSVYFKAARLKAMTVIKDPNDYRGTRPDMEIRYDDGTI